MNYAAIGPIAIHLPEKVETNAQLQADHPRWNMEAIAEKTGILQRHVAAEGECSSDLGVAAAKRLFDEYNIDPAEIDFLIFCTQTPDYALPTTACLVQQRLGLPTHCGAFDFNLGCSGFVYGLSIADGLIRSGAAKRILFITAETYTKMIDEDDRSLRTIFGDGAAATLIESSTEQSLRGFRFGTDGAGADTLLAACGGFRPFDDAITPRHKKRWKSDLYMDGPSLINFTVGEVPELVRQILESASLQLSDIGTMLFHQATRKMLEQLIQVLEVDEDRLPIRLQQVGNTVSSTIPILIHQLRTSGELSADQQHMLIGFGVGWSWAGCVWQDVWQAAR